MHSNSLFTHHWQHYSLGLQNEDKWWFHRIQGNTKFRKMVWMIVFSTIQRHIHMQLGRYTWKKTTMCTCSDTCITYISIIVTTSYMFHCLVQVGVLPEQTSWVQAGVHSRTAHWGETVEMPSTKTSVRESCPPVGVAEVPACRAQPEYNKNRILSCRAFQ